MGRSHRPFDPRDHLAVLRPLLAEVARRETMTPRQLDRLLRRHPKDGRGAFSKSELLRGWNYLAASEGWPAADASLRAKLRLKPMRTASGVAPVTVLTRPHPCPGRCVFCPQDVRMPRSYLASEPGARRAAGHAFDPYLQTWFRLRSLSNIGHRVDKVELIVLGGSWSSYPAGYQRWFLSECLAAMNDFGRRDDPEALVPAGAVDWRSLPPPADQQNGQGYNGAVRSVLARRGADADTAEVAGWPQLEAAQRANETAQARCVGLTLETRPDLVDEAEALRLRRLGATRVQVGIQSLSDRVLAANRRDHDSETSRRALGLLRQAGFKLQAHWMPNLYGSDPVADRADFDRLWSDPQLRPDELKIYPCSLVAGTELEQLHAAGRWRPYQRQELAELLADCLERVPPWCRVNRVIRDIPSHDILAGNRETNFRQVAEQELGRRGAAPRDIRAREIGSRPVEAEALRLEGLEYAAGTTSEQFLQLVTDDGRLAAFLRLSLPQKPSFVGELEGSAVIRQVHVYGAVTGLGQRRAGRAQHAGLGRRLVETAAQRARAAGFRRLAVISGIGTRDYYRRLGFVDGRLYQHREL